MKKSQRMNVQYKISFILMIVCVALLIAAFVVSYVLDQSVIGVIIAAAGAALCVAAIVLALLSKPRVPKVKRYAPDNDNHSLDTPTQE